MRLDASIAAWAMKQSTDSMRPITAMPLLFHGQKIRAWVLLYAISRAPAVLARTSKGRRHNRVLPAGSRPVISEKSHGLRHEAHRSRLEGQDIPLHTGQHWLLDRNSAWLSKRGMTP
jgi:hypothetical protein